MSFPHSHRELGVVTEHVSVPNSSVYQSTEKTMWVENVYSGLQFNVSVTRWWKALISDTFSVCFLVDKGTWGKSPFHFSCSRWLCQHIACQALDWVIIAADTFYWSSHTGYYRHITSLAGFDRTQVRTCQCGLSQTTSQTTCFFMNWTFHLLCSCFECR